MFKFVVLVAFVVTSVYGAAVPAGMLPQLDGRIVGGHATDISEHPWQISLQRYGSHSCGGSIYAENIVVTAAHCVVSASASALKVRVGSTSWTSGGKLINVAAIKYHEGYNPSIMINDVAILKLAENVSFSSNVKSISLASQDPPNGAAAVCTGWGTTSSGGGTLPKNLLAVDLGIVSRKSCSSSSYGYGSDVKDTMICAEAPGKDACQGDSGGPLVSGGKLVGIVSWGYGCAFVNYPGVYCSVASVHDWVVKNAQSI